MERIRDHWDGQQAGCLPYVYHGPAALVALQREVAKDAGLRTYPLEEALGNRLTVHVFPAQCSTITESGLLMGSKTRAT